MRRQWWSCRQRKLVTLDKLLRFNMSWHSHNGINIVNKSVGVANAWFAFTLAENRSTWLKKGKKAFRQTISDISIASYDFEFHVARRTVLLSASTSVVDVWFLIFDGVEVPIRADSATKVIPPGKTWFLVKLMESWNHNLHSFKCNPLISRFWINCAEIKSDYDLKVTQHTQI